jgi:GNAT superfamily N-acetyltransferase
MLLDIATVARLEEARQARSVASISDVAEPIAGGFMCFGGPRAFVTEAMGLGFDGAVSEHDLERFVEFYTSRGVEPKIELCPLADESLVRGLAARGFVLRDFEHVLVRDLAADESLPDLPDRIEIVDVRPGDEPMIRRLVEIAISGSAPPNTELFERLVRRAVATPEMKHFAARVDGQVAAIGGCEVEPPLGSLFGMSTLPAFQRRGCQRALMIHRIRLVREHGCRYVTVQTKPHVATGRNALRLGFQVAYTKAILARPGPDLISSP